MPEIIIFIYWGVVMAGVVALIAIRVFVLAPALRRRGEGALSGLLNFRLDAEFEKYKEICLAEGRPSFWHEAYAWIERVLLYGVLGWTLLLIVASYIRTN